MFDKSPTANLIELEDSEDQLPLIDRKETPVTETRTSMPFPSSLENSFTQVPPSHSSSSGVRAGDTSASHMENAEHLSSISYENTLQSDVIALQTERSQLLAKAEMRSQSVESISAMLLAEPSIKKPSNTVFWIRLIRSRWLLIQLRTGVLELWDLDEINLSTYIESCDSIDGTIDDSAIEDDPCHNIVMLYVSTRSWIVYHLALDLPHRGEVRHASPKIVPSICFRGFAGLSDVKGALLVFSRTTGRENAGFIGDCNTAATVYLQPNTNIHIDMSPLTAQYDLCRIKHEVIDIKIHEEVVIVARNCNFDIYSLAQIIHCFVTETPTTYSPCAARSSPCSTLGVEREAVVLLSAESSGCYGAVLRQRNDVHPTSLHKEFRIEPMDGIAKPASLVFHLAMGQSGRRFATLSERFLTLYPTHPQKSTPARNKISEAFASWLIPGDLGDIPGFLEFDEVTGICVVVMASGRIWVVDATGFKLYDPRPMPPNFEKGDIDATFIPNPDPARWPLTLPLPPPFGISHPEKSPRQVAPGWSDEVERYFPFKNRPDCMASTPWFIHEAAHIPILQPGYSSFNEDTYARTLLFTVDELERWSISHGYKEIIEVKPSACLGEVHRLWLLQVFEQDWYFYKLKLTETLETVIDHLRRGERVEGLLEDPRGECWPLDATKVDQYLRWNFRYFSNFGRPGRKLL